MGLGNAPIPAGRLERMRQTRPEQGLGDVKKFTR